MTSAAAYQANVGEHQEWAHGPGAARAVASARDEVRTVDSFRPAKALPLPLGRLLVAFGGGAVASDQLQDY